MPIICRCSGERRMVAWVAVAPSSPMGVPWDEPSSMPCIAPPWLPCDELSGGAATAAEARIRTRERLKTILRVLYRDIVISCRNKNPYGEVPVPASSPGQPQAAHRTSAAILVPQPAPARHTPSQNPRPQRCVRDALAPQLGDCR